MAHRDIRQRRTTAWRRASLAVDRMSLVTTAHDKETARRWAKVWSSMALHPRRGRSVVIR
jgi:hypothetical protein